ncbi:DUF3617 family protein [Altererythrobacter salegens]|uniref:DUF3617 family protein n=1 Tax=Croceibacterium salegens TaxID=1737568 RepID=A0A6I4SVP4_9SPHN|nr:DUF3617 family protein [Croceibacterium salegens]MXO59419.1 DUF3617 family protein [Croceibacterium salegens]
MQRLIAVLALTALAGCEGKKPDDEAILAQAEKLATPLPGLYRSTTTFEGYDLPNADGEDARIVRDRLAGLDPQVREFCLTPAEGGFRDMLKSMQDGDCTIERFTTRRRALDAQMHCAMKAGGTSTVKMTGTADPVSSQIRLDIDQLSDGIPGGQARLTIAIANERTGDCPQDAATP